MLAIINNMAVTQIPAWECNNEKFEFLVYFDQKLPSPNINLSDLKACVIYNRDPFPYSDDGYDSIRKQLNFGTLLIEKGAGKVVVEMPPQVIAKPFSLSGNLNVVMKNAPDNTTLQLSFPETSIVEFKPMELVKGQMRANTLTDFVNYMCFLIALTKNKNAERPKPLITEFEFERLPEFPSHLIKVQQIANRSLNISSNKPKKKDPDCIVM